MSSWKRSAVKYGALLALMLLPLELAGYATCLLLATKVFIYVPQHPKDYARYLAERDPLLGWPAPNRFGHGEFDASGSRLVPSFPDPATPSCVAAFGDSFTWGDEVAPKDAVANWLSQRLHCRVANYGIGGYGTDQAVLRFERIHSDAKVVVLGHYSDNIIRNVNQARDFITNEPLGLKPRFILDGGTLKVVPLPQLTQQQYFSLVDHAEQLLPHEYHRPGGPSGLVTARFPFLISALRALGHYRVRAWLHGQPSYAQFYRADHASGGLPLTVAIAERFVAEAKRRNQQPLVLLIPDVKDLVTLREHKPLAYQSLFDELSRRGVPVISAAQHLDQYLGQRPPCDLYFRCSGSHFRPEGNRELAALLERTIRERGWLAEANSRLP